MKISEIKKKYKNEWVLAKVLEKDKLNRPTKLRVLAHSKDREKTYEALRKTRVRNLAHFFTGPIPKKGYAVAF